MHSKNHDFLHPDQRSAERRTHLVIAITILTMVAEIAVGTWSHSMALTADGWHMGSHAAALGITAFAYSFSRKHANNERFSFGTGKVGSLAAFTSAVVLAIVALLMCTESIRRLLNPVGVSYDEALWVAVVGLAVNLACAFILGGHGDADEHHHDHNLRAAYLHVLADALTSIMAIVALAAGKLYGWGWLDSVVGLAGAVVVGKWAIGLMIGAGQVLVDAEPVDDLKAQIIGIVEEDGFSKVLDIHIWRVGPASRACILSITNDGSKGTHAYRKMLESFKGLDHVTVEIL